MVPVRAPRVGIEVAIRGLRAVILYGPQFPHVTDSHETLTSIFFQLSSTTATDSFLADQPINQAFKKTHKSIAAALQDTENRCCNELLNKLKTSVDTINFKNNQKK